jgi:hypothetical protein
MNQREGASPFVVDETATRETEDILFNAHTFPATETRFPSKHPAKGFGGHP